MKWFQRIVALLSGTFVVNLVVNDQEEVAELSTSETFQNFVEGAKGILMAPLLSILKGFFSNPNEFFMTIGSSIMDSLGLTPEKILSGSFVFLIVGLIVGIWLMKYIISWGMELLSKLLDPA